MRSIRLVVLSMVVALVPLTRAGAQTCQGTAQFREGRARVGADYQHSSDLDLYRIGAAYGVHDSFFGEAGVHQLRPSQGGSSMTGFGATLGYQVHWVATPFQVCPLLTFNYASDGRNAASLGLGGSIGYRVELRSGFQLVPAIAVRWIVANSSSYPVTVTSPSTGPGGAPAGFLGDGQSEVSMNFGMVFHRVWSAVPGVLIPSPSYAKTRWTVAFGYNFGN